MYMENAAQPVTYESYSLILKNKMIEPENVHNKNIPANEQDHKRELEDRTGEDDCSICFDHQ